MGSWFVRPRSRRLALSDDQWILVKDRLTSGEQRAHLKRCSTIGDDGVRRYDSLDEALSLIVAYLLDWSLAEQAPIAGVPEAALIQVLNTLEPGRFIELKGVVEAHDAAMTAERVAEKNGTAGETASAAISPSPSAAVGSSSGSETLM
jgi:hypothetical protein